MTYLIIDYCLTLMFVTLLQSDIKSFTKWWTSSHCTGERKFVPWKYGVNLFISRFMLYTSLLNKLVNKIHLDINKLLFLFCTNSQPVIHNKQSHASVTNLY